MIARVVGKDLADDLNSITDDYYSKRLQAEMKLGNTAGAVSIINAAQTIGGPVSDHILQAAQNDPGLKSSVAKYQLAREQERAGFEALLNGKYDAALKDFQDSENTVNGYHQVFEIHRYLKNHRREWENPESRRQIFKAIADQFYRGAPTDLLQQLRDAAAGPSQSFSQPPSN